MKVIEIFKDFKDKNVNLLRSHILILEAVESLHFAFSAPDILNDLASDIISDYIILELSF